jgi:hypothetical protein
MGLNFDLATLASLAGLGGSTVAGIAAFMFFKGFLMRILAQVIVTAGLSFVGFIALFNVLGFKIIPPQEIAGVPVPGSSNFSPSSAPAAPVQSGYTIQSPWSK